MNHTYFDVYSDTGRDPCYDYPRTPLIQRTPGKQVRVTILLPALRAALLARFNLLGWRRGAIRSRALYVEGVRE